MSNNTSQTSRLDRLANAYTACATYAEFKALCTTGYYPTIRSKALAAALHQDGIRSFNSKTSRSWF